MTQQAFEQCILDAVAALPDRFRHALNNVAFLVEYEQRIPRMPERRISHNSMLLGLYQGVPLAQRGAHYSLALPDKITLFQNVIEQLAGFDDANVPNIVRSTVLHEIAHHFGFSEARVRNWEASRHSKKKNSSSEEEPAQRR